MFSNRIIGSARFIKMPPSIQALYFHLCLNADDDGVVEAYPIMRMLGSTEDDVKMLHVKNLVTVLNEDLVSHITDWLEHNSLRADRKVDSVYQNLLLQMVPETEIIEPKPRSDVKDNSKRLNGPSTDGIGKVRIGKVNLSERKLVDPKTGKKPTTASGWTRAKRVSLGKEPNMEKKEIPPELLEVDTWVKDHRAMTERNGDDYTFLDDGDNKRMRGQIGKFIPKWIATGKTRKDFFQKLEVNHWARERGYNPFLVYTEAMMTSLLIGGEQKSKRVNLVDIDK